MNEFRKESIRVVLFFTRGLSLQQWDKVGILDREAALYKQLQQKGAEVTFITYGGREDLAYAERIPGIHICCNRFGFSGKMYEKLIPFLFRRRLRKSDIIKSNQTDGAEIACRSASRYRIPFVARCGYMWSEFIIRERGENAPFARHALMIEEEVFTSADRIIVTTDDMAGSIADRFPGLTGRTAVIPNYVDTLQFRPDEKVKKSHRRLCFAGRLVPQKNLETLFEAVRDMDIRLDIIGDGPLRQPLENAAAGNPNIVFHGRVPNDALPEYFNRCSAFILPSLYEGHPKTLIEAMACGLPVIATEVPGIRELLCHGRTGWLCRKDARSLRSGIETVLGDHVLRERLGAAAREYVQDHFSLEKIAAMEIQVYRSALGEEVQGGP